MILFNLLLIAFGIVFGLITASRLKRGQADDESRAKQFVWESFGLAIWLGCGLFMFWNSNGLWAFLICALAIYMPSLVVLLRRQGGRTTGMKPGQFTLRQMFGMVTIVAFLIVFLAAIKRWEGAANLEVEQWRAKAHHEVALHRYGSNLTRLESRRKRISPQDYEKKRKELVQRYEKDRREIEQQFEQAASPQVYERMREELERDYEKRREEFERRLERIASPRDYEKMRDELAQEYEKRHAELERQFP